MVPSMEIRLDDKVALVTGASRGIGKATAETLAAAGAKVMLSSRKQDDLEVVAAGIVAAGGEAAVFAANAGEPDQAEACVEATLERFGGIDVLVNNAATNPYMGPAIEIDLGRYDKTWQVNLRGPLVWTQAALAAGLDDGNGGAVVNVASVGGMSVEPGIGIYNTTKAALIHLTKVLASELGPKVRVNAVAPGLVKTDMARALWEKHEAVIAKRMPMARLGEPEDIANAVLFLVSDLSSWITGHTMVIDGGALVAAALNRRAGYSAARCTLPRAVVGSDARSSTAFGTHHDGSTARTASCSAPSAGGSAASAGTTTAVTTWPHSGSGRPTTATAATPATDRSTRSTGSGHTFSPPVTTTSPRRPCTVRRPSTSSPSSPVASQPSASLGSVPSR